MSMRPIFCFHVPGFSSDVYSFGVLLWEMLTLKSAYENFTRDRHFRQVIVEGV